LNFYVEFDYRLNELYGRITDFIMARDLEKDDMITELKSGRNINVNPHMNNNVNNIKNNNPNVNQNINPHINQNPHINPNIKGK